uniref:TNF superfamily member 8 n=1 Tax=Pelodiscus sinensis TaxID=13735 RepID=K7GF39_PELSI
EKRATRQRLKAVSAVCFRVPRSQAGSGGLAGCIRPARSILPIPDLWDKIWEKSLHAFLRTLPSTSAAAYLKVSKPINNPKLKWTHNGILQNITFNSEGDPIIQTSGLYLIYCNLHFHLTNFSGDTIDLKMEVLVNNATKRQTLFTHCTNNQTVFKQCASVTSSSGIFQELSIFHLVNLDADDWISVKTEQYKYLDLDFLPNDSVLAVLRYSGECTDCSL